MNIKIETDDFDREYSLSDLLKLKTLKSIFLEGALSGLVDVRIKWPDGRIFFETVESGTGEIEGEEVQIRHDAEIIADLVTNIRQDEGGKILPVIVSVFLEKIMDFQKKVLMTSGLHGKIVESSYEELMEKNQKLSESEEKYKNLAENLEVEVTKKTEEIKKTLTILMQKEKLASIGNLAAGMAHEINNPLGFIMSNLKMLGDYVEELCSETTNRKDMDYIRQDTTEIIKETTEGLKRIQKIVSDLKTFSAIDSPDKALADINSCIDSCLRIIENQTKGKIKITKKYGFIPRTIIDVGKINQMILAILMNSIQAMTTEGNIFIETSHLVGGQDYFKIMIADDGCGIAPENINMVFDPFFTTKDVGKGMGLGLTAARETARMHGGDIVIKNRQGGGVSCTVIIPMKE